jgi:hypothetical protein
MSENIIAFKNWPYVIFKYFQNSKSFWGKMFITHLKKLTILFSKFL